MANESKTNIDQKWQNLSLVRRLSKPLSRPGVIKKTFADNILSRTRNITTPASPILMRLIQQRGALVNETGGEKLQLARAQWLPTDQKNLFRERTIIEIAR